MIYMLFNKEVNLKSLNLFKQNYLFIIFILVIESGYSISSGQIIDSPGDTVAGIPANYTEAKTDSYILPDPLKCLDGEIVKDSQTWYNKRRDEIINLFEQNQFGVTPKDKIETRYDIIEREAAAFGDSALRTQIILNLSGNQKEKKINLVYYLPKDAGKPVPMLLYISFGANSQVIDDPEIKEGFIWNREKERIPAEGKSRFEILNVRKVLENGFGFANVYYGDIEPDFADGYKYGVRNLFKESGDTASNSWGSIAVWSWGLSRILDYFETDNKVDANGVVIMGVSRLGKTVLWAGALDKRFAAVVAVCSGESGATLSRRNYGETIAHIASPKRYYYWFAPKYQEFRTDVNSLPVDGHMLISLIAPRPILLITGNTDKWSDPYGEYLAAKAAEPVYELLGKKGLDTDKMPFPGNPVLNDIGFYMHEGGHGMMKDDWNIILDFLNKHF